MAKAAVAKFQVLALGLQSTPNGCRRGHMIVSLNWGPQSCCNREARHYKFCVLVDTVIDHDCNMTHKNNAFLSAP